MYESNTRTFFQLSLFSLMNCSCRWCTWYLSCDARSLKTMCKATSNCRSLTSRFKSSARTPAPKKTSPSCLVRYFRSELVVRCQILEDNVQGDVELQIVDVAFQVLGQNARAEENFPLMLGEVF